MKIVNQFINVITTNKSLITPVVGLLFIVVLGALLTSTGPLPISEYNNTIQFKTDSEQERISLWLVQHNLNEYGDPKGTVYDEDGPLVVDGKQISIYRYIALNHPDSPWNSPIEQ